MGVVDVMVTSESTRFGHNSHPVYSAIGTLKFPVQNTNNGCVFIDGHDRAQIRAMARDTFDLEGRHFTLRFR